MRHIPIEEIIENSLEEDPIVKPIFQKMNNLILQLVAKLDLNFDPHSLDGREIYAKLFEINGGYDVQFFIRGKQYSFEEAEKLLGE